MQLLRESMALHHRRHLHTRKAYVVELNFSKVSKYYIFFVVPILDEVIFYTLHVPCCNDLSKIEGFNLTKPLGPVLFDRSLEACKGAWYYDVKVI